MQTGAEASVVALWGLSARVGELTSVQGWQAT